MGAVLPLNQSPQSLDLFQDISTKPEGSTESSFFDHLIAPSSFNHDQAPAPLPWSSFNTSELQGPDQRHLNPAPASSNKPVNKKTASQQSGAADKDTGDPLIKQTPAQRKSRVYDSESKKQPNVKEKAIEASHVSPKSKEKVPIPLKTDVKNILKRLGTSIHPTQQTGEIKQRITKNTRKPLPLEKGAFRIRSESETIKNASSPEKTTLERLVLQRRSKSKGTQQASRAPQASEGSSKGTLPASGHEINGNVKKAKTGNTGSPSNESPKKSIPVPSNASASDASRKTNTKKTSSHSNQKPADTAQTSQTISSDSQVDTQSLEDLLHDFNPSTKTGLDSTSTDSDANYSFNRGGDALNTNATSQAKGKSAANRTSRALNWLKTLSERTSMMDKTNPQWKVLEMKLEEGKGTMTVKVMKEEEVVSVTVSFSDPEMKALAETNTERIIESLRNQYQQDVNFSFNNEEKGPFESFTPHRASHHFTKSAIEKDRPPSKLPETLLKHEPQGHVWIG